MKIDAIAKVSVGGQRSRIEMERVEELWKEQQFEKQRRGLGWFSEVEAWKEREGLHRMEAILPG